MYPLYDLRFMLAKSSLVDLPQNEPAMLKKAAKIHIVQRSASSANMRAMTPPS